ncbi:YfjI family protein [Methylobacterium sp. WL120]|uniref:YfjI family protein n=1 Tax=Methylobacterium sp. WL120 TaxID=2603887 RepID=UPI0011CA0296|nr:YfjI family protein [Methylobacterium sp. WL120]TXM70690.1 DUF3987 domain-containing protein [Methylobacterium sp. WL120]
MPNFKETVSAQGGQVASLAEASPLPLVEIIPDPLPYPVECLGEVLGPAAAAIAAKQQVPLEMAAQSVLAAAALVAQGLADVLLPFGQTRPLSLFVATLAETGDRKTSTDTEAFKVIEQVEKDSASDYHRQEIEWSADCEAWRVEYQNIRNDKNLNREIRKAQFIQLGSLPIKPPKKVYSSNELTFEGLVQAWPELPASFGIFTSEGGQFTGGYSMAGDARMRTAAGLSVLWDGKAYKRLRVKDGLTVLNGRRLSIHLMIQPDLAGEFLNDDTLRHQGLLSRLLISYPKSLIGSRGYRDPQKEDEDNIRIYHDALRDVFNRSAMHDADVNIGLILKVISMSDEATQLWKYFYNWAEFESGKNKDLYAVRDIASKSAEQVARIAATISIFKDPDCSVIQKDEMLNAQHLMVWYLNEAIRLRDMHRPNPDLQKANTLLEWIHTRPDASATLKEIMQIGPVKTRLKKDAELALTRLIAHNRIIEVARSPRAFKALADLKDLANC